MLQAYPVILTHDDDAVIAEFPDVPEAITHGADEKSALEWAQDALVVALSGYLEDHRDIPQPSKPKRGQSVVALPPMVGTKLAIYQALRDQGVTQLELAERLNCDARQIRRILDLDHSSRLDQLEASLRALGKKLSVDIQDAA
ncbi:MAG: type II toxin-antitoxin system HicB family antitoxin [Gammaproteobacteria bacterium]|nr:type II toxin-antitoxin system HicB family antitoxin [Gammaproteobacteria bacterium]